MQLCRFCGIKAIYMFSINFKSQREIVHVKFLFSHLIVCFKCFKDDFVLKLIVDVLLGCICYQKVCKAAGGANIQKLISVTIYKLDKAC